MRPLIIGASGFIGSHVADKLLNDGARVRGFDRAREGFRDAPFRVDFRQGDVTYTGYVAEALVDVDIPYGGDHSVQAEPTEEPDIKLPDNFALALCRIEPENNVAMILEAFSRMPGRALAFVGNWNKSEYGRDLRRAYGDLSNITLLDPVYDPGTLRWIRDRAVAYIHGHSAGATNPSLVEMMHFGIPVFAHGCSFNRFTTEEKAAYFSTPEDLIMAIEGLDEETPRIIGAAMHEIAQRRYTWETVGRAYFELVEGI